MNNKVMDISEIQNLQHKLRNRFAILAFIQTSGITWAIDAINPNNTINWTHDKYLECYNNPKA